MATTALNPFVSWLPACVRVFTDRYLLQVASYPRESRRLHENFGEFSQ